MDEIRLDASRLFELLRKHRILRQTTRPPNIIFTGKTGAGKTSTINALFGKAVGNVGHTGTGTTRPETYKSKFEGENLNLVDLPGLGDGDENDAIFREHYKKAAPQADGIIVVVTPPRPAEIGTADTVNCLLEIGVNPEKIIFGYNKIGDLRLVDPETGSARRVEIDGVNGPRSVADQAQAAKAVEDFVSALNQRCPNLKLTQNQVVAYDSDLGWNLYALLGAVVATLPLETLRHFEESTREERESRRNQETDAGKKDRLEKEEDAFVDKLADKLMLAIDVIAGAIPAVPKKTYLAVRPAAKAFLASTIKKGRKWWGSVFG